MEFETAVRTCYCKVLVRAHIEFYQGRNSRGSQKSSTSFCLTLETAQFPDKFVMGPKRKDGLNDGSIFCFGLFVLLEQLGELIYY